MKLFVSGLPSDFDEVDLKEMFELYGTVESAKLIVDHQTQKSKGYGFLEIPDETEGQSIIATLNGKKIAGKKLIVNKAEDRQNTGGGSFERRPSYGDRPRRPSYGNNNGGGDNYRPRRDYNNDGGQRDNRGSGEYRPRRDYNNEGGQRDNRGSGEYRPRRDYNNEGGQRDYRGSGEYRPRRDYDNNYRSNYNNRNNNNNNDGNYRPRKNDDDLSF